MKTLDLYCDFKGWQGGTIHQALADFRALPVASKDAFCNRAMRHLDAGTLADVETFSFFTRARLGR